MRARPPAIVAAAAVLAAACGEKRPPTPVVTLEHPTDTAAATFGEITTGVWLEGNRWAVLAPATERVEVADLAQGTTTPLGGEGTRELRSPATLFRTGDSLYVGDWGLRRTSRWTLDGRFTGAVPASDAVRGVLPRAADGTGRFYLEMAPPPGPEGLGNRDSSAVVRTGPAFTPVDTLARLAPLDVAEVVGAAGRRFERRVLSGVDQWGALPDGSVWVARVYENRVDWRSPGGEWSKGEPLPDRVLEVTRYDRELFLRRFPPELRATAQQLPFAAVKPPFEAGLTSPSGDVWLEKSRAPTDSSRAYHVVDRRGVLFAEVRLPGQGHILAVGRGAVLVYEATRDGARLLRFAVPPFRPPVPPKE
jgi:hypothetical protein